MTERDVYKVVILGAGGVGKSSLIIQYVRQLFYEDYDPTVEDAYTKKMEFEGERISVDILDTAGQEAFSSMRDEYIHKGEGFLLVYSLRSKASYMEIPTYHRQICRVKNSEHTPCVIVESMCDLAETEVQEITEGKGESLAAQLNTQFIHTSAKLRINVDKCFNMLLKLMKEWKEKELVNIRKTKSCCCILV